ncbi:hypothetical protein E6H27_06455 [Candidatus Bathyarchaeota archaeon]|nr:MAG: hypothetical protein E6H27_06455 [Candidatus Bathyarchaeota archaeon]
MMHNIQAAMPGEPKGLLLLALILSLAFPIASLNHYPQSPAVGFPLGFPRSGQSRPLASLASAAPYDEQVGVTFTQDFSKLTFNVTAVAFSDPHGVGPGYLVNGLTDHGYWYQVGLSYHWPLTLGGFNPGFNMNYEVFDNTGFSIDPSNGGGGLKPFNGPVNAGDIVLLSLSFGLGSVVMRAMDWQTGAASSHSYPAHGSTFLGLQSSLSSQLGFFTGLMTEHYHSSPYYGTGLPVTYNETGVTLSSAWMWMDEWNTDTGQSVFRDNTTEPVQLDDSLGQYFTSNGTAEMANAHGLVTGLTPVTFPTLETGPQATGRPDHQAVITMVIRDPQGATVRFENLTISTSFGKYNISVMTPFSFSAATAQYNATISLPADLKLGDYNLTIDIQSWGYLDSQAQEWIALQQTRLNETLVVTNNPAPPPSPGPNPPNNPGPTPPSTGKGPSTPTNNTTPSPNSWLTIFHSIIIPVVASYAGLGLLAFVFFIRQERKRSTNDQILGLRFCQSCGTELGVGILTCPSCGLPTEIPRGQESQAVNP